MLVPQVITLLQEKVKDGPEHIELDATVIKAAVEGLQEHQALQKQVEQLQEQMSMKPSVARKLAEKIKKLEVELEVTQNASRVKELERKVQKLELDLKQSYSTKNFTLKQGLLDLEKRYRTHIYGNEEMEELWREVMYLLVEDKDKEGPGGAPGAAANLKRIQTARRVQNSDEHALEEGHEEEMPNVEFVPFFNNVQRAKDYLQEAREREARLRELAAANGNEPYKMAHIPTQRSDWDHDQLQSGNQVRINLGGHISALRALFDRPGGPVFPGYTSEQAAALQEELAALQVRVGALLDMWAQRILEGPVLPGSERAAELEAVAQEVLASIRALKDKYRGEPTFDKQMDGLVGSINELRASWGVRSGPPAGPRDATVGSANSRRPSRAAASPRYADVGQGRTKELVAYFMSFLQSKGYMSGPGGITDLDGPIPLPPFAELFAQFHQYMQETEGSSVVASMIAADNSKPRTPRAGEKSVAEMLPAWMQPLPSLRISTAAEAAGLKGVSEATMLEAALPGTPSWWAAALHAAGEQGNAAVLAPGSGPGAAGGEAAAPFNPLLLPGPARTMQALAAHVRAQNAELLAAHPEAEALLQAALEAATELQGAQDRSLLAHARNGTSPFAQLQPSPAPPPPPPQAEEGAATAAGEAGADAAATLMQDVTAVPLSKEDYTAEVEEMRTIASKHAEHAAALQELLNRVAEQHTQATERADDLDVRLSLADKETKLLREEVDSLTKLLVDVKMAYAERTDEVERLSARLKRSLQDEKAALDEVEELRKQLAIVVEEQVALDAEYEQAMVQALEVLDKGAEVLTPEAVPLAAVTGAGGNVEALTNAAAPALGLPPTPPTTKKVKKSKKAAPKIITPAQVQAAAMVIVNQGAPPPDAVSGRYCALPVVAGAGVIQDQLIDRVSTSSRMGSLVRSPSLQVGHPNLERPSTASMAGSVAGSVLEGPGSRSQVARVLSLSGAGHGESSMRRPSIGGSGRLSMQGSQSEGAQSWAQPPESWNGDGEGQQGEGAAAGPASGNDGAATSSYPVHVAASDAGSDEPGDGAGSVPPASDVPHENQQPQAASGSAS